MTINSKIDQRLSVENLQKQLKLIAAAKTVLAETAEAEKVTIAKELNADLARRVEEMVAEQAKVVRSRKSAALRKVVFKKAIELNELAVFAAFITEGIHVCVYYTDRPLIALFTKNNKEGLGGSYMWISAAGEVLEKFQLGDYGSEKMLKKLHFKLRETVETGNNVKMRSFKQLKTLAAKASVEAFTEEIEVVTNALAYFNTAFRGGRTQPTRKMVDTNWADANAEKVIGEIPEILISQEAIETLYQESPEITVDFELDESLLEAEEVAEIVESDLSELPQEAAGKPAKKTAAKKATKKVK